PEAMVDFINEFLSAMIDIAMEEGGTVERFLGDAVMVIWGAPTAQPDHAERACRAALTMAERIRTISRQEAARMGVPISVRIGINSGSMIAGNIGANRRFNYTVLGDCVNLAARLEGVNKLYGTTILVGSATEAALDKDIERRFIDTVRVKGRGEPEQIYELLGRRGTVPGMRREAAERYGKAWKLYRAQRWDEAAALFDRCAEIDSDDDAARAMAQRCRRFEKQPPGDDWDGVFDIETK
ncbi:MAG: adenylate/guanylate cyclase domain-containing protein, partial [Gammaproteobacteria bacterium]|nr:adenylate/guanylate cyclase domain-containing protein [Gammaproteobacteria bacterium]